MQFNAALYKRFCILTKFVGESLANRKKPVSHALYVHFIYEGNYHIPETAEQDTKKSSNKYTSIIGLKLSTKICRSNLHTYVRYILYNHMVICMYMHNMNRCSYSYVRKS